MPNSGAGATLPSAAPTRRDLLVGSGVAAMIVSVGGVGIDALLAAPSTSPPPADFLAASRFVTGSALSDQDAIARAWGQLVALDAGFPAAVGRLAGAIRQGGFKAMGDFLAASPVPDAALLATARTITSAFYLGYTGTPGDHVVKDDTGFVTFAGALMWRPTIDATVIPTYARGGTDYWIQPPPGTPTPAGKPGVSSWQGSSSAAHHPQKA